MPGVDAMSDEAEYQRQLEENRRAYEALRDEIHQKYPDKYVAIAFGRIVAVDPDYHKAVGIVDAMEPKPGHSAIFRGDDDGEACFVDVENLSIELE
jgi:hypothetical protein